MLSPVRGAERATCACILSPDSAIAVTAFSGAAPTAEVALVGAGTSACTPLVVPTAPCLSNLFSPAPTFSTCLPIKPVNGKHASVVSEQVTDAGAGGATHSV